MLFFTVAKQGINSKRDINSQQFVVAVTLARKCKSLIYCAYIYIYIYIYIWYNLIFVNNQLDAQFFFMYVYFYSLHVSDSYMSIIRTINCINIWYAGAYAPAYQTTIYKEWHKPGVALIRSFSWWWAHGCPKHVQIIHKHTQKLCVRSVIYKEQFRRLENTVEDHSLNFVFL